MSGIAPKVSRRAFLKSTASFSAVNFLSVSAMAPSAAQEVGNPQGVQLDPDVPYSPGYISIYSDLHGHTAAYSGTNPWIDTVEKIEAGLVDLHRSYSLSRAGISVPLNTTRYALDLASATAVPPASYVTLAIKKKLDFQTNMVLSALDESLQSDITRLSSLALREVTNSQGIPIEALFPSGNPELAVQNIKEATELLLARDSTTPDTIRQEVSEALLNSLLAMYEEGLIGTDIQPESSPALPEEVSQLVENVQVNSKAVSDVAEERIELLEKGGALAQRNAEALRELRQRNQVSQSTRSQIHDAASTFKEFLGAAKAVGGAMRALGMPPEDAAVFQKSISVLASGTDVVLALTASAINPLTAISAVAGFVTSIFGSSGPDPVLEYLKHLDKKLDYIIDQNEVLIDGQRKIVELIGDISENQVEIAKMLQGISRSLLINRSLITSIVSGPIKRIEDQILNEPSMQAVRNLDVGVVSYDDISNAFSVSGDRIFSAMRQLEELFSNDVELNPIFLSSTYEGQDVFSFTIGDEVSRIAVNQRRKFDNKTSQEILSQRLEEWPEELDAYYATEFASFGPLLIGDDLLERKKTTFSREVANLIEVSPLISVANVALFLCRLYPFVTFQGGWRLKTEEEIKEARAVDQTGLRILSRILKWLDIAIMQSNLISEDFRNVQPQRWISKLWIRPAAALAEASVSIGGGLFDLRWLDQAQAVFWQYERGGNILQFLPCSEVYSPPWNPIDCGKLEGASEEEILEAINLWLTKFRADFEKVDLSVEVRGFWPSRGGVDLSFWLNDDLGYSFPKELEEIDTEWMAGLVPWINAKRNKEKIQNSSVTRDVVFEIDRFLQRTEQGNLRGEGYVREYPNDGYFDLRYDALKFHEFARQSSLSGYWTGWRNADVAQHTLTVEDDHWRRSLLYQNLSLETSVLLDLKGRIIQALAPKNLVDNGRADLSSDWHDVILGAA